MPVGAIATAVTAIASNPQILKKGGEKAFKVIRGAQNFITNVVSRKKEKAELKAETLKSRIAQLEALQGGTTGSNQAKEGLTTALAFGGTFKPSSRAVKRELEEYKTVLTSENKQNMYQGSKMQEWLKTNWVYVAGAVVALMLFRKKR